MTYSVAFNLKQLLKWSHKFKKWKIQKQKVQPVPVKEWEGNGFRQIVIAGVLLALLVGIAFAVADAHEQNDGGKHAKEPNTKDKDDMDWAVYDYISITGVNVDEAKPGSNFKILRGIWMRNWVRMR